MITDRAPGAGVRLRRRVATLFDDEGRQNGITRGFNLALAILIVVNVSAVILESVDVLRVGYSGAFLTIERVATAIFTVEYALRVWTAVDLGSGRFRQPLWGRLRYVRSFFALVDLFSILPAILGLLGAGDLRVLRLVRLLRMLKLTRHSRIFGLIWSVLRQEGRAIGALVFILTLTVAISGALMFMIEGEELGGPFTSIPVSMWWAIETLTTVGYGDMVPATAAGRVLGGIVAIVGIATLALFSGLITVGFLDQLRHRREAATEAGVAAAGAPRQDRCPHCGFELERSDRPRD